MIVVLNAYSYTTLRKHDHFFLDVDIGEKVSLNREDRPCLGEVEMELLAKEEKKPNFMRSEY